MSETPKENQTEKKKGGSKMIIVAVLVVVLLGGAGGGFYLWRSKAAAAAATEEAAKDTKKKSSKKAAAADDEDAAAETDPKADKKTAGKNNEDAALLKAALPEDESVKHVIELQPFIINLADTEQARYLRLSVSLGVGGEETTEKDKPDQLFITRVRNAMLAVLSNKKSDDVLSVEGKTKLRKELLKAAQAASDKPEVEAIYITDFIVQL